MKKNYWSYELHMNRMLIHSESKLIRLVSCLFPHITRVEVVADHLSLSYLQHLIN